MIKYVDEDGISILVSKIQVWDSTSMSPSLDVSCKYVEDFN
jgi:hypothetical protein